MTAVRIYRRRFPVSLSIVGGPGADAALVAVAAAFTTV
jgi:Asp-tRNA(Asn)/Glu-tRNA(Gln) amidotransferase A subunit family amidase